MSILTKPWETIWRSFLFSFFQKMKKSLFQILLLFTTGLIQVPDLYASENNPSVQEEIPAIRFENEHENLLAEKTAAEEMMDSEAIHEPAGEHEEEVDISFIFNNKTFQKIAAAVFALAILHTFMVSKFSHLAQKYPEGSIQENLFHLIGEVEAVFMLWSGILIATMTAFFMWGNSVHYINGLNFTEPMFVFVIMIIAATKPIIDIADYSVRFIDKHLPLRGSAGFLASVLIVGPLLGSFITEPAAMTVTALILYRQFFIRDISTKLKYMIIATLFVNVSVGGALTNFAAPPVIMVAGKWGWDLMHMLTSLGWKAAIAVVINAYTVAIFFKNHINKTIQPLKDSDARGENAAEMKNTPLWITLAHILFLAFTVLNAHHAAVFMAGFVFFLGFATVTREYQEKLKLREGLLVGGFLAGLVTIGSLQKFWIQPVISMLPDIPLFFGAVFLTSFTDNAALTFLASQVEGISAMKQYLVVAGALAGGGLTVIANAPNPAGFSILNPSFGKDGINPVKLLTAALFPTAIVILSFLLLPSL
ncbi:MAG: hypothetical protein UU14_C0016G0008 [Candidatus Roizmanbacteria bacterium GW2011_GWB1_40_7]|uniref:Na+/H+ antiporter n=2 Tax=Candidatus Roizmaniibacteriota TaxID=1752723 RepID=A0A0G0T490_9BACT|nr:MAG: hypothetical protein UU14_C0016G0008 [Candidatus Roizmanbacteria bacterium GW2011_GWB1_40_7]KKR93915.1 MAG: hypothetical protein UU41_C0017G0008 [Candidatus Roizmanbacteria bacterium GW2011_GWA1_41_13]